MSRDCLKRRWSDKLRALLAFTFSLTLTLLFRPSLGTATYNPIYSPETAPFALLVKGERVPFSTHGLFVLPGTELTLTAGDAGNYSLEAAQGTTAPIGHGEWVWTAPTKPGVYPVRVVDAESNNSILLNVFVMVPAKAVRNGSLNGYKIGNYPRKPLRGNAAYIPPQGFVEVTPENRYTKVSPHFRLSQFLCKQTGSYPKYVVLNEKLLAKLENLLGRINEAGFSSETISIMSGYRTPYYNRAIGNVAYSRHQWGDAADIFIDRNRDNIMDDLNGDGRIDRDDCEILTNLIEDIHTHDKSLVGGMGSYRSTRAHGPFVHVDARGEVKTW